MDASGGKLTGAQKEELMDTVKQQIAVANAHELLKVCIGIRCAVIAMVLMS